MVERAFVDLKKIYPSISLETENYIIFRNVLDDIELGAIRNAKNIGSLYIDKFISGSEHVVLYHKTEGTMMSDHPSETITNQDFINKAKGDVLIFGLGLGLIVFPLLNSPEVTSITIVEKDPNLPEIIGNIISPYDTEKKVKIVSGDAFTYFNGIHPIKTFDTIYFDIWAKINENSFIEMEQLHETYKPFLRDENSYLNSWCYDHKDKI